MNLANLWFFFYNPGEVAQEPVRRIRRKRTRVKKEWGLTPEQLAEFWGSRRMFVIEEDELILMELA